MISPPPFTLPASVVTDSRAGGAKAIDSTGVADGQAMIYDSVSGKWKPAALQPVGSRLDFFPSIGYTVIAGTWTLGTPASFGGVLGGISSNGTQNEEVDYPIYLSAGTWTFSLIHRQDTTTGIVTVSIDSTSVGTIDTYNASASGTRSASIAGIVVPTSASHTLALKMASKNASSTNYYGYFEAISLVRTA